MKDAPNQVVQGGVDMYVLGMVPQEGCTNHAKKGGVCCRQRSKEITQYLQP